MYVKVLDSNHKSYYGLQYHLGLNTDPEVESFDPVNYSWQYSSTIKSDGKKFTQKGLYYTNFENIHRYIKPSWGSVIAIIRIPEGVPIVWSNSVSWRSPQIIIEDFISIRELIENRNLYYNEKIKSEFFREAIEIENLKWHYERRAKDYQEKIKYLSF